MHRGVSAGVFELYSSSYNKKSMVSAILSNTRTNLTPSSHHKDYRHNPKSKLTTGDNRKPDSYWDAFPCDDVHPGIKFSGISSESLNNKGTSKPEGQYDLCDEGRNDERESWVEGGLFASIFRRT